MTLHTIVDGYCFPPLTKQTPVLLDKTVPVGYKYTRLPVGEGRYNYEELEYDWRETNKLTSKEWRFIFRGHQRQVSKVEYDRTYSQ